MAFEIGAVGVAGDTAFVGGSSRPSAGRRARAAGPSFSVKGEGRMNQLGRSVVRSSEKNDYQTKFRRRAS